MREASNVLRVGVIGTGGMGGRHVMNLHRHVKAASVSVVMDLDTARAAALAEVVGARVATDWPDVIGAADVDAVVVASPDATHEGLALACVDSGTPGLIEKPLGISETEAQSVVGAEVHAGRRLLQVGLMRHFDPQHTAVVDAIASGEIGRPVMFRGWHRNPRGEPRPSTRHSVFGSAVHDLDSARWILDSEPRRVFAAGTPIDPTTNPEKDLQLITMEMANETIAVIEVNQDSGFGYEVGIEVVGSRGTITTPPHHTPTVRSGTTVHQRFEPDWLERFDQAYIIQMQRWVESLSTGVPVGASAWDGYATLIAAEGVLASLNTGDAIDVDVPPRPALYSQGSAE